MILIIDIMTAVFLTQQKMKKYNDEHFGTTLGSAVKALRMRSDISQETLRKKAGLSTGYISRLEDGQYQAPSIVHIFQIAQAFKMTLRDLLEYAELIPRQSSFESCLRGEGHSEEQIAQVTNFADYVLYTNKTQNNHDKKS
jgi:transcriptional regulator with XRE-family HTH domain